MLSVQGYSTYKNESWRLWNMWRGAHQKLGDNCWLLCWGFPAPWSHNKLGRTWWMSSLWGLLKKTWIPQSYHPSGTGVSIPYLALVLPATTSHFSQRVKKWWMEAFVGKAFWAWQSLSGWWGKRLVVWCLCHSGKNMKSMNPLCSRFI